MQSISPSLEDGEVELVDCIAIVLGVFPIYDGVVAVYSHRAAVVRDRKARICW